MSVSASARAFSSASMTCAESLPGTTLTSSLGAGWTSTLLLSRRVRLDGAIHEVPATPDQQVSLVTRGEFELSSFDGTRWRGALAQSGTVSLTPPGFTDRLRRTSRRGLETFEVVNLFMPSAIIEEASERLRAAGASGSDRPLTARATSDAAITQALLGLKRAAERGAPDIYAETLTQWLAVHLLSPHASWRRADDDAEEGAPLTDRRLGRAVEYMTAHFAERVTLDRLADEAGVSKFHFARLFQRQVGRTPHAYLVAVRFRAARGMLLSTDVPVSEIAISCGYNSLAHFTAAFTSRFGASPTHYRDMRM